MARKDVGKLRDEAAKAIERGKLDRAIELYEELEVAEPTAPTWPKRIGETHRRNGDNARAVAAFERAAEKYLIEGFLVQAIAVCKLILQIDPKHHTAQARLAELMPARTRRRTTKPATNVAAIEPLPVQPPTEPARPPLPKGVDRTPIPVRAGDRPAIAIPPKRAPTAEPVADPPKRAPTEPIARVPDPPKRAPTEPLRVDPQRPAAEPARTSAPIARVDPKPARTSAPSEQRLPRPVPRAAPPPEPSVPAIIVDRVPVDSGPKIDIPVGSGLDAIDFSMLIPGAQPQRRDDGTLSGVSVLPLDDDLELSLDDAEIGTDPLIDPLTDRKPGPAARRALLTTPLFPQVPPRVLETLIARMSLIELAEGEVLFREGETGHELFVISEGEVAVESTSIAGRPGVHGGELARLGPSAFFGEIALVTDLPRSATIRAVTRVELLAMNREVLRDALAEHPEILTVMLRFVRDRLIDRITRTSELFRPFTELERKELSSRFELVEVVPDAVLITQGERADGLYLVVAGKVEVQRSGEGVLATLGSGDVFGELSLLAGGGSTANVRSVTRVLALRMPASTFQEVIMTHPQVLAYLGDLAERRTPRAQAEEFVDLHLDMLV